MVDESLGAFKADHCGRTLGENPCVRIKLLGAFYRNCGACQFF
jgi:hypothetical protein